MKKRVLSVYGRARKGFSLTVFCLFFLSSSVFAATDETSSVKRFAALCHKTSAKIVASVGRKASNLGHKAIETAKKIDPKEATIATAKFPFKAGWEATKGSIYPLWAIGKGGVEYLRSKEPKRLDALKEVLWNRWLKDKGALLIGGALWGLQQTTGLTVNQYHKLTSGFDEDDDEGIVVVIDNFGDDLLYRGSGEYVYNRLYKPKYGERVFFLKDIPFSQIPAALKKLSDQYGPIGKVDYYGHGHIGRTVGNGGSPSDLMNGTDPLSPIMKRPSGMENLGDPHGWYRDMFETKLDPNIFSKNAKVRFNSCFIGNGPEGELFGRAVANSWLRHGGSVYTSNVQILPSAGEFAGLKGGLFIPPQWVRSVTDHLVPLRGAVTAYTLLYDIPTHVHNSDRVVKTLLTPGSRVKKHTATGESTLRDEFEKAWASGFDYNKVHQIYDSYDVRHYSSLRQGTPERISRLLIREDELEGNGTYKPYAVRLVFDSPEKAKEYMSFVELDREMMDQPEYSSTNVILKLKPNSKEITKGREYAQQLSYANAAKENLKNLYKVKLSEAGAYDEKAAEIKRYYLDYTEMLPLYLFPHFMDSDLPKNPKLYKAIDDLKTP